MRDSGRARRSQESHVGGTRWIAFATCACGISSLLMRVARAFPTTQGALDARMQHTATS
jgi:hypothetical protein